MSWVAYIPEFETHASYDGTRITAELHEVDFDRLVSLAAFDNGRLVYDMGPMEIRMNRATSKAVVEFISSIDFWFWWSHMEQCCSRLDLFMWMEGHRYSMVLDENTPQPRRLEAVESPPPLTLPSRMANPVGPPRKSRFAELVAEYKLTRDE